jgi:WXXGXW repeat (2 copies)
MPMSIHKSFFRSLLPSWLLGCIVLLAPLQKSQAQVAVSIDLFAPPLVAIAPPPLPVYVVPVPPAIGFMWMPGYWGWDGEDYYWVPGTWLRPPRPRVLWTPGYWAWRAGAFAWSAGYWGPRVGFYGGINYGGGYFGSGFYGGRWVRRNYNVNRSVVNVTNITRITNVTNVTNINRVEPTTSFNGGPGGVRVAATPAQLAMAKAVHPPLPQEQVRHVEQASHNQELHAFANRGAPPVAATRQAADFAPQSVVAARSAGVASPEAERHNARVRENPAQANGAALPRGDNPAGNPAHERQALVPDRPVSPSAALPDVQEAKPPAENRVRSDQKARDVPSQRAQQPVPDQAHPRRMQAPRDDGQANPDLRPRHPQRAQGPAAGEVPPARHAREPRQERHNCEKGRGCD